MDEKSDALSPRDEGAAPEPEEDYRPQVIPFPEEARPNIDHLITEDDTPLDSRFIEKQQRLLVDALYGHWTGPEERDHFVAMANVGLFATAEQTVLVPDVLVSLDVDPPSDGLRQKQNRSYFVWVFGKVPDLVIESVSDRRGGEAGLKMKQYAHLKVTYYVIFDPAEHLKAGVLRVFWLCRGAYVPLEPAWFPDLGVGLTLWHGRFEGMEGPWLRWCNKDGNILPTGNERAEQEKQRAEQEKQRAEQEKQRAEQEKQRAELAEQAAARLREKLRALGIDPDA